MSRQIGSESPDAEIDAGGICTYERAELILRKCQAGGVAEKRDPNFGSRACLLARDEGFRMPWRLPGQHDYCNTSWEKGWHSFSGY